MCVSLCVCLGVRVLVCEYGSELLCTSVCVRACVCACVCVRVCVQTNMSRLEEEK